MHCWCNQTCAHRLPASFIPSFTGSGGALQPEKRPGGLSRGHCNRTSGLPIQPRHLPPTVGQARLAHGRKDPEELAEAGDRVLQVAGREENPGARAQATESQARSRSGAPGDVRAQDRTPAGAGAVAAGVGAEGWDQSWGGTDARGARPGSRGRPRWPSPPCSRRVVFWLPRLLLLSAS